MTSCINIIVSPILSSFWGSLGVSLSIVITAFLNFIYINVVYYKVLKINVFEFYKKCYVSILFVIVGSIAVILPIINLISDNGWISFIIKAIITGFVFLLFVLFIHVNKEERKQLFSKIFKRR